MQVSKYSQLQQSALRFPFLPSFELAENCNNQYNKKYQYRTATRGSQKYSYKLEQQQKQDKMKKEKKKWKSELTPKSKSQDLTCLKGLATLSNLVNNFS